MQPIRFVMIGGFLGAGKTTLIGRIARHFIDTGLRVGVVTNDQAFGLVDTMTLRGQGLHVDEVPGACFCCKFDELVATVERLGQNSQPDVIIAEPVGSCTDLVATVIEPLRHLHGSHYTISPLTVLLKPEHGKKILGGDTARGFSPQAAYIFLKQLEEAEVIVLNKSDKLSDDQRSELVSLLQERFPERDVIIHSSHTGEGFEAVLLAICEERVASPPPLEIDYDVYAAGEAELGWLNATGHIRKFAGDVASLGDIACHYVTSIAAKFDIEGAETAHLKVLVEDASSSSEAALANLVGSQTAVELSIPSERIASSVTMTINARVAMDPERLAELARETWLDCLEHWKATGEWGQEQFFRPGRPTPTHRVGASE